MQTNIVKYVVMKMGKRDFHLVSIHPAGKLKEARASAIYAANHFQLPCMITEVIDMAVPDSEIKTGSRSKESKS